MTDEEIKEVKEQLAQIKPGETYPGSVVITEEVDGEEVEIKFLMQSYVVGMYCAIYQDNHLVCQTGDHNNTTHVRKLKKDIGKALERGATVEIGAIVPCKTMEATV